MNNILFILAIATLSILNSSCDRDAEVQPKTDNNISIQIKTSVKLLKSGDDEDDPLPDIPVLKGKATNSDGSPSVQTSVELVALPESNLVDQ